MGRDSKMPCFNAGVLQTTNALRQRFQLHLSADEAENFVETDLIAKSFGSYYTRLFVSPPSHLAAYIWELTATQI
jgi:phosphatidylinositol 4-kinase